MTIPNTATLIERGWLWDQDLHRCANVKRPCETKAHWWHPAVEGHWCFRHAMMQGEL